MNVNKYFLEEFIKQDLVMRSITKFAFEKAKRALISLKKSPDVRELYHINDDDCTKDLNQAEGMIMAICYLPNTPFAETTTAINFLYYLLEDEESAEELY